MPDDIDTLRRAARLLADTEGQLDATRRDLAAARAERDAAHDDLAKVKNLLDATRDELRETVTAYEAQLRKLVARNAELEAAAAEPAATITVSLQVPPDLTPYSVVRAPTGALYIRGSERWFCSPIHACRTGAGELTWPELLVEHGSVEVLYLALAEQAAEVEEPEW